MPNITIEIFEGRTLDQRRQLVRGITDAAVEALGIDPSGVRITFFEIQRHDLARGGVLFSDMAPAGPAKTTNGTDPSTAPSVGAAEAIGQGTRATASEGASL